MKKIDELMNSTSLSRAITRIAHQVLEKDPDIENLGIIGMQRRGVFLAKRIASEIERITDVAVSTGTLDITLYRDDYRNKVNQPVARATDIPFNVDGMGLLLVDDVLYTGRTARAALDALMDFGRPAYIRLAVLVDRGHREVPIRADFTGKKITTARNQKVRLSIKEIDRADTLDLVELEQGDDDVPRD